MIERVKKISIIDKYTRVGIRYINGFDFNIFEKVNLSISLSKDHLTGLDSTIRMTVPSGEFISTLQVINDAEVKNAEKTVKGSIIDIDTHIDNPKEDIIKIVEQGHLEEKKLFFTLLKEEFVKKELNPEY